MAPITIDIDDVRVTLRSIERNKVFGCKCESNQVPCQLKQKLSLNPSPERMIATEAVLNIRNTSSTAWPIETSCWELIDTDGYAYKAKALCDVLRPSRTLDLDFNNQANPGTQVDFVLVFPELTSNTEIACMSYWRRGDLYLFPIDKSKRKAHDLVESRERLQIETIAARGELSKLLLAELEGTVQSRLGKTLTRRESEGQERKVKMLAQKFHQSLQVVKPAERKPLEIAFQTALAAYQAGVDSDGKRDEERKKGTQTIESLRRLSPSEFEEYIWDLFERKGYQKVTLRGKSGDQGADILAEKMGDRVAIQCKRYKGKVGSPEVRDLLGAMEVTESRRGFLVTTAIFSLQAEEMEREHPIELIDGNKLIEWIAEARAK